MSRVPDALAGFITSLRHGLDTGQHRRAPAGPGLRRAGVDARAVSRGTGAPYFARIAAEQPHDDGLTARLQDGARRGDRGVRGDGAIPARGVRPAGAGSGRRRPRAVRHRHSAVARHEPRPRGDLRLGLGRAASHRGGDGRRPPSGSLPARGSRARWRCSARTPARSIEGIDNLLAYLQDLTDRTITELDGTHFDIPAPLHRIECREAPPGTAAAMYYTAPSADFSRPGRTWYPAKGRTRFPALDGDHHRVPRGRPGPSPPDRALHDVPGAPDDLPAPAGDLRRPRRRLGALRRATDAGARATSRTPTTCSGCSRPRPSARCA